MSSLSGAANHSGLRPAAPQPTTPSKTPDALPYFSYDLPHVVVDAVKLYHGPAVEFIPAQEGPFWNRRPSPSYDKALATITGSSEVAVDINSVTVRDKSLELWPIGQQCPAEISLIEQCRAAQQDDRILVARTEGFLWRDIAIFRLDHRFERIKSAGDKLSPDMQIRVYRAQDAAVRKTVGGIEVYVKVPNGIRVFAIADDDPVYHPRAVTYVPTQALRLQAPHSPRS